MQGAHQQSGRDSCKLRDGQKAIPARQLRKSLKSCYNVLTVDKFSDELEMLRRRSQPDESNIRMNLAVASKFVDGVKNGELRITLATDYTPLSTKAPTPEELRPKSRE